MPGKRLLKKPAFFQYLIDRVQIENELAEQETLIRQPTDF